jgi:Ca2+-binding EF-hand superfamily protein
MGCLFSACMDSDVYKLFPDLAMHRTELSALGLRNGDVAKLYTNFRIMDDDHSGSIDFGEMLDQLDTEATPFARRVFNMIDGDGSGTLDVCEFMRALWEYCTLDRRTLVGFTFDLYDSDCSNTLEVTEVISLCKDVYGSAFGNSKLSQKIVKDVKVFLQKKAQVSNGHHFAPLITKPVFFDFCRTHPGLLYPAFQFQLNLRQSFQGEKFWNKVRSC